MSTGYNPYRKANGEFASKAEAGLAAEATYNEALQLNDESKIKEIEDGIIKHMPNTELGQRVLEKREGLIPNLTKQSLPEEYNKFTASEKDAYHIENDNPLTDYETAKLVDMIENYSADYSEDLKKKVSQQLKAPGTFNKGHIKIGSAIVPNSLLISFASNNAYKDESYQKAIAAGGPAKFAQAYYGDGRHITNTPEELYYGPDEEIIEDGKFNHSATEWYKGAPEHPSHYAYYRGDDDKIHAMNTLHMYLHAADSMQANEILDNEEIVSGAHKLALQAGDSGLWQNKLADRIAYTVLQEK